MNSKKIYGFLICLLGLVVLGGCTPAKNRDKTSTTTNTMYEEILLTHDGRNTVPQITTLHAGKNYKFVITPDKNGQGCMSTIKRAGTTTQDTKLVIEGEPVEFVIDNAQPGEYKFVCNGMGMEQGSVIIQA